VSRSSTVDEFDGSSLLSFLSISSSLDNVVGDYSLLTLMAYNLTST